MSSPRTEPSEIALSLNAAFVALANLQAALERGGFVGGDSLTNLGTTNLVTNPSNQDPSNPSPLTPLPSEGREVFDYWRSVMGKKRSVFDRKRQRAIGIQLKLGRSVGELKRAVDGCKLDPFSMGQNDRAQVYNDFCLIFRDAAHVEKFLAIADGGNQLPSASNPEKLRIDAASARRKQETRQLLERQDDKTGRTDQGAAKQRLAELVSKIGKPC